MLGLSPPVVSYGSLSVCPSGFADATLCTTGGHIQASWSAAKKCSVPWDFFLCCTHYSHQVAFFLSLFPIAQSSISTPGRTSTGEWYSTFQFISNSNIFQFIEKKLSFCWSPGKYNTTAQVDPPSKESTDSGLRQSVQLITEISLILQLPQSN